MHQQIGVDDLLQGGSERLDQLGRQVPDEPHGVGQNHRPAVVELSAPRGGFQCGEQRIFHQDPGAGEGVEQAGLASIGIADDRDRGHVAVQTTAALGVADLFHVLNLAAQLRHPLADPATVGLDLGLAGPTGTNAAAAATGAAALS